MKIHYQLNIANPNLHLLDVELKLSEIDAEFLELFMPVWTPGSYMVREFSKNINFIKAFDANSQPISCNKLAKNKWTIETKNNPQIVIQYQIYAFELSVRTSYIDQSMFFLNGASVFLGIKNHTHLKHHFTLNTSSHYSNIVTYLSSTETIYTADCYDILIDNPILGGEIVDYEFVSYNTSHKVYFLGEGNYNTQKVIADLQKITTYETTMMGENPCENYHFYIVNTDKIYGGLEHTHNSLNMIPRWNYSKDNYLQSISLLAHEYFHLWNIKRIRPITLGPFNYDTENYTNLLWFVEGFTSYFDDYFVYKAGVSSLEEYLDIVAKNLNTVVNTAGDNIQSLADASFDAWIKYYRQNENSPNTQVSYYTKGGIVATALNLKIIIESNAQYSLDDVMKYFYLKYKQNPEIGFTDEQAIDWIKEVTNIDVSNFIYNHIYDTQLIDYASYFIEAGITLKNNSEKNKTLGIQTLFQNGKLIVSATDKNYAAHHEGIYVGDEIIAINKYRVGDNIFGLLQEFEVGQKLMLTIARQGELKEINITCNEDLKFKYTLERIENPTEQQIKVFDKWLSN
jgi:predicted metalloprotease with PDZ domain